MAWEVTKDDLLSLELKSALNVKDFSLTRLLRSMRGTVGGQSPNKILMNAIISSVLAVSSVVLFILLSFTFFLLTESSFFQGLPARPYSYYIIIGMAASVLLLTVSLAMLFRSIKSISISNENPLIQQLKDDRNDRVSELDTRDVTKFLDEGEREIYGLLVDAGGSLLQRDIASVKGLSKATITRILNRLEAKGIIERIRHGTTNMIVLKRISK